MHAARKLSDASSRGKCVNVRVRHRSVTMDDVMKHFSRKSTSDKDNLYSRLPASPTPSVISCSEIAAQDDKYLSPHSTTSVTKEWLSRSVVLTTFVCTSGLETALLAMRGLVLTSASIICAALPNPWRTPCQVLKELTRTQYYLNLGQHARACASYDKALSILPHMQTSSYMSILQLILHLCSWSMDENTSAVTKAFFHYLADAKPSVVHPVLAIVAKTIHGASDSEALFKCNFQQLLCDTFEHELEPHSGMLFCAKIRLCRFLILQGQLDRARNLLQCIRHHRARTGHQLKPSRQYEIDREIAATLCLLGDYRTARHYLDGMLNHHLGQDDQYGSRLAYTLQQMDTCNSQLGLYNMGHSQALKTAKSFAVLDGKDDSNVRLSVHLRSSIDRPIQNSNVSWVRETTTRTALAFEKCAPPNPAHLGHPTNQYRDSMLCTIALAPETRKGSARSWLRGPRLIDDTDDAITTDLANEKKPATSRRGRLFIYCDIVSPKVLDGHDAMSPLSMNCSSLPPVPRLTQESLCNGLASDHAEFDFFAGGTAVSFRLTFGIQTH